MVGSPGWQRATLSISAQEPGNNDAIDARPPGPLAYTCAAARSPPTTVRSSAGSRVAQPLHCLRW
ncbi:conserved protein of unknown function [Ectopseudomonas oleovorans]|uniref:Uncharacterized protein n=1 Tax=Ectopseudomonas oleovorans TaxID=301 RepID=A0A653B0Z4_ECTOL|nr:conserved protein of unknown function [Pseudomonas oleovorans]